MLVIIAVIYLSIALLSSVDRWFCVSES